MKLSDKFAAPRHCSKLDEAQRLQQNLLFLMDNYITLMYRNYIMLHYRTTSLKNFRFNHCS